MYLRKHPHLQEYLQRPERSVSSQPASLSLSPPDDLLSEVSSRSFPPLVTPNTTEKRRVPFSRPTPPLLSPPFLFSGAFHLYLLPLPHALRYIRLPEAMSGRFVRASKYRGSFSPPSDCCRTAVAIALSCRARADLLLCFAPLQDTSSENRRERSFATITFASVAMPGTPT